MGVEEEVRVAEVVAEEMVAEEEGQEEGQEEVGVEVGHRGAAGCGRRHASG